MKYDAAIDRESAYEILTGREAVAAREKDALARAEAAEAEAAKARKEAVKAAAAARAAEPKPAPRAPAPRKSTRQTPTEAATSTFMRTATRELTKFVFRGMFSRELLYNPSFACAFGLAVGEALSHGLWSKRSRLERR